MKRTQWMKLISLDLMIIVCIFLPFLPGPFDELAMALSALAQTTGLIGLVLVPIGILWLIQESRIIFRKNEKLSNWSRGYYYAIVATILCTIMALFLSTGLFMIAGPSSAVISLVVEGFVLYKLIPSIKALKQNDSKYFNAAPLYLISIPLVAFAVRVFLIGPISDYSRNYAIERGEALINAIDNYYAENNNYPESVEELDHIPKPFIMGIEEFEYKRTDDAYNLWFIQWQVIIATKEVVMYNPNDQHNVRGHYASFNARQEHWKYYWLD